MLAREQRKKEEDDISKDKNDYIIVFLLRLTFETLGIISKMSVLISKSILYPKKPVIKECRESSLSLFFIHQKKNYRPRNRPKIRSKTRLRVLFQSLAIHIWSIHANRNIKSKILEQIFKSKKI